MLVYGKNVAKELLKKDTKIKKIYLQDSFDDENIKMLIENKKIDTTILPKVKIDDLIEGKHQGIILDIEDYQYKNIDEVLTKDNAFVIVLDHIEDPHNFGAIIRTSEAAGVDAIIIPNSRQIEVNSTVMKTSAGALANIDIIRVSNIVNTIEKLKKEGFWVVGTTLSNDSVDYKEIDYSGKIALVIGNEGKGMAPLVEQSCDFKAHIPMYGKINSLNASVATAIMIYEVIRNRK